MAKRVLMVAYHFPPSGAVAALRAHKFARYLPEFDWEPFVVAHAPDPRQPRDDSYAGRPAAVAELDPLEFSRGLGLLPGMWRDPLRRFLFVPDEELSWGRRLRKELPRLIETLHPDVLWSNSVPTSSLVAAAEVARRTGLPLVLDFHNEWTRNMYYRPPTRFHDAAHRRLERLVIETARAVVTLNPLHTEDLRVRFPQIRCETIENGFDPGDYSVEPADPGRRPLVFSYVGAIYGYQTPEPFLRALAASGRQDVEVRIVGDRFGQFSSRSWPFPVRVEGHRSHRDLGGVLSRSSAFFLCLESPASRQLPAKLYEYLRAERPTFAIVPRGGVVESWLAGTGGGVSVPVEEPECWAGRLRYFIEEIGNYRPPAGDRFHRKALTARLAVLLDAAARGART